MSAPTPKPLGRPVRLGGRLVSIVLRRRTDGRIIVRPVTVRWIGDHAYRKRRRS